MQTPPRGNRHTLEHTGRAHDTVYTCRQRKASACRSVSRSSPYKHDLLLQQGAVPRRAFLMVQVCSGDHGHSHGPWTTDTLAPLGPHSFPSQTSRGGKSAACLPPVLCRLKGNGLTAPAHRDPRSHQEANEPRCPARGRFRPCSQQPLLLEAGSGIPRTTPCCLPADSRAPAASLPPSPGGCPTVLRPTPALLALHAPLHATAPGLP